jgi:hypothetical protein
VHPRLLAVTWLLDVLSIYSNETLWLAVWRIAAGG